MNVISLQSGSSGNCIFVEAGGTRLLFDAGISGRQAKERLAAHGRDIASVNALIISHDHGDHSSCAGIFQRRFRMPIHITGRTLEAVRRFHRPGKLGAISLFRPGDTLRFGEVIVETIPTPHDGAEGSAFIVDDGAVRLGIFTDLGHVYRELRDAVSTLDGALLESNFDRRMLEDGPYPRHLKERISGPGGHISNTEAAELAGGWGAKLRMVCLAHLSGENNTPDRALETFRLIAGNSMRCHVAGRYGASGIMTL